MPSIAVVIPCHNVEKYLRRAVESALSQSKLPDEIVLVDNNSTDNTMKVIEALVKEFDIVRSLTESVPGASAARNLGWKNTTSEFIQFLDADDVLQPESLAAKEEAIVSNAANLIINGYERIDESGRKTEILPELDLWTGLFMSRFGHTSSNLIHRSLLERIGGWDTALKSSQETNLYFEILKLRPKYVVLPTPLTVAYDREGQISKGDPIGRWTRIIDLRGKMLDWLSENQPDYFSENKSKFQQLFFEALCVGYRFVPELALAQYEKCLAQKGFTPQSSPVITKAYLLIHRLVGFQKAQQLKTLISRITG
jgi:glycosyltransferase involved in cell wall biosynthesis